MVSLDPPAVGAAASAAPTNPTPSFSSSRTNPQRKVIESNETYVPPPNPYLEAEEDPEEELKKPSVIEKWMDSSVILVDCFEEIVNKEKLEGADLIGVSRCGYL